MLRKLSEESRECHERAAEARQKAETTDDPAWKADFLDMEKRWLALAGSYDFTERLGDFTAENLKRPQKVDEYPETHARPNDAPRLQELSGLLIQEGGLDALYERLLDVAISLMSADFGSMQTFDPERRELQLLVSRGFHPDSAAFWDRVHVDSACTCGVALSAGRRVTVPDIEACDFMTGTGDLEAYRRSNIRAVQSTPLVSRSGRLLGMISTHWHDPHQPTERALQSFDVLARQAADLIERSQSEAALLESEERYRWLAAIVEFSDDAIISKNLDGIITSWNKGAERVFGYLAEEVVGKPVTILIPPDRHNEEPTILGRIRRGERIDHYETVRRRKDGSLIAISLTVSPVKNAQGKIVGASKIARDITERKRSEELIAMLAREAEHRTRNVLATVQAAVHLSHADTPGDLKRAIAGRIEALAKAHTLFVQSRWAGVDLATLAAQELAPYLHGDDVRARIDGPQFLLVPAVAQPIAMTLHELATNAAKYGALSVAKGRVEVKWSLATDGRFVLDWSETGGPRVTKPKRQGFGTRVIEQMITGQLKGTMQFDWRPDGLACEIAFPFSPDYES